MQFDDLQTNLSVRNICASIEGLLASSAARFEAVASLIISPDSSVNLEDIDLSTTTSTSSSSSDTIIELYAKIDR